MDNRPPFEQQNTPKPQVRRNDRAIAEAEWIDRFLTIAAIGQFALVSEGRSLLHSSLFWYDRGCIYWHSAAAGTLATVLARGATPCSFTVAELGRILPAATPFAFSAEYASVVCDGTAHTIRDGAEKRRAMEGLMTKYAPHLAPGVDYAPMPDRDVAVPDVYCLLIEARIGKHNVKPLGQAGFAYVAPAFIDLERAANRLTTKPGPHLMTRNHKTQRG